MVSVDAGSCLLYTSDAADDLLCVDLGGRRSLFSYVEQSVEQSEQIEDAGW